jgi:hypothetical protein
MGSLQALISHSEQAILCKSLVFFIDIFCGYIVLASFLIAEHLSKFFSSKPHCRPRCVLIFLLIWFLSRQPTLYIRSHRWLKLKFKYHTILVCRDKSVLILCSSLHTLKFQLHTASGWWSQIHKTLTSIRSICRRLLSRHNHQKSNLSLEQT